jgi:hypothetical protein
MRRITLLLLTLFPLLSSAADYYVSPAGADTNPGTQASPWKTLTKVNGTALQPGDRVMFQGGSTFSGTLSLGGTTGTVSQPITITSYGTGRATLSAGTADGITGYNGGGVTISNLILLGAGFTTNTKSGINWYTDTAAGTKYPPLIMDQLDISGFSTGISVGSWGTTYPGWQLLRLTNSRIHHNSQGVFTYDNAEVNGTTHAFVDLYIGNCEMDHNNGSGTVICGTQQGLIEDSVFHNNARNGGLWTYATWNLTIQRCIAHNNKRGNSPDGFGFDLDGGSKGCIIQYCLSYNNETPGFVIFNYNDSPPTRDNIIRYCISENDCRLQQDWGSFMINAYGTNAPITNCHIYNNIAYLTTRGTTVPVQGLYGKKGNSAHIGCSFRNNVVYLSGAGADLRLVGCNSGSDLPSQVLWQNNVYYVTDPTTRRYNINGTTYTSLSAWRTAKSGQEMLNGNPVGSEANPVFSSVGTAGTLTSVSQLASLTGYRPQLGSPLMDTGLNLNVLFTLNPGTRDFTGTALPQGAGYDIGACEMGGVRYFGNGNTGGTVPTDAGTYTSGATMTVLENTGSLVRSGYVFGGWRTTPNATEENHTAGTKLTVNASGVNLYANWFTAAPIVVPSPTLSISGDSFVITVPSILDYRYQLQTTTTLDDGSWSNLGTSAIGTGAPLVFIDSSGLVGSRRFYRFFISPVAY